MRVKCRVPLTRSASVLTFPAHSLAWMVASSAVLPPAMSWSYASASSSVEALDALSAEESEEPVDAAVVSSVDPQPARLRRPAVAMLPPASVMA